MKKTFSLILVLAIIFLFGACGATTSKEENPTAPSTYTDPITEWIEECIETNTSDSFGGILSSAYTTVKQTLDSCISSVSEEQRPYKYAIETVSEEFIQVRIEFEEKNSFIDEMSTLHFQYAEATYFFKVKSFEKAKMELEHHISSLPVSERPSYTVNKVELEGSEEEYISIEISYN